MSFMNAQGLSGTDTRSMDETRKKANFNSKQEGLSRSLV